MTQQEARQEQPKTISVLGSTGSIGTNTLDLVSRSPERYKVKALTGNRNISLLAAQAKQFQPDFVAISDPDGYKELKSALSGTKVEVAAGLDAINQAACLDAEWVMAAIVGAAGLAPTLSAVRRGATVGLANKESLVCAGSLMTEEVKKHGATLLPVDSEHNAIFQVLDFDNPQGIEKILLTASGGPFRTYPIDQLANVTPAQAVAHPNWDMGAKISVDSATMMNKGLELIEAFHLFPVREDQIEIVVHPQSVVHSMVAYIDGSVLAQLGSPDMRTPIGYALNWPHRGVTPSPRLNLAEIGKLEFFAPDPVKFPSLRLARQALQKGGNAPTILNAVNEIAVGAFLSGKCGFFDIARLVEEGLSEIPHQTINSIEDVFETDTSARHWAKDRLALI